MALAGSTWLVTLAALGTSIAVGMGGAINNAHSTTRPAASCLIKTISGKEHRASIQRWTAETLTTDTDAAFATRDIVDVVLFAPSASRPAAPSSGPSAGTMWRVATRDGERLIGSIAGGNDELLLLANGDMGRLRVALERIKSISRLSETGDVGMRVLAAGESMDAPKAAEQSEDVIELANADRTRGLIERVDEHGVSMPDGATARVVPWKAIRRVTMAEAPPVPPPERPTLRVHFADDVAVVAHDWVWEGGQVRLTRPDGDAINSAIDRVERVEVCNGRWAWLTDLPPLAYTFTPYLSLQYPMVADANVMGGPLACGGSAASHGIGLHSAAAATWRLNGEYEWFRATVCIDDSGGAWSDADMQVLLDGQPALRLEHLKHGSAGRDIELNVADARLLEIRIGFGANGDVQDRVNLMDAGLVRPARARPASER